MVKMAQEVITEMAQITAQQLRDKPEMLKEELERLSRKAVQEYKVNGYTITADRVSNRVGNLVDGEPWDGVVKTVAKRVLASGAAQRELGFYSLQEIIAACEGQLGDNGDGGDSGTSTEAQIEEAVSTEQQSVPPRQVDPIWICERVLSHEDSVWPGVLGHTACEMFRFILARSRNKGLTWVSNDRIARHLGFNGKNMAKRITPFGKKLVRYHLAKRFRISKHFDERDAADAGVTLKELRGMGMDYKNQGNLWVPNVCAYRWPWKYHIWGKDRQVGMPPGIKKFLNQHLARPPIG